MKIILIIIKFIFIYTDCQDSCVSCTNNAASSEDRMLCSSCKANYYPLTLEDTTINCYLDNFIINGYFFDRVSNTFKKCHNSCQRCTGEAVGYNTNCIICNTASLYYPIDGNPTFCKKIGEDDAYLVGYYLDTEANVFKTCYSTCETCLVGGDSSNHNCQTCKENYFENGNNCFLECPEELFNFGYKCVSDCMAEQNGYYLELLSKTCVDKCPTDMKENEDLGLCTIERSSVYEDYDCKDIIEIYIEPKIEFYISDNSLIIGKNCYIQVYLALDQYEIHKVAKNYMLSKLFLNTEYLNTETVVIKIDYNQTYNLQPEVNDIEFILYSFSTSDNKYHKINDLDLITPINNDDLIYIEKPFIYTENIRLYQAKYELFDIFNAKDPVYNNICISFKSEYNTDVTYDYRREIYFYNLTQYCLNDSTIYYSSFISDPLSIQCKSNYIENNFIEKKVGDSKYKIFKCKKYFSKKLTKTYGFWVILFYVLFNVGLIVPFLMTRFTGIINFMRIFERSYNKPTGLNLKWTILNPPKKNIKVIYNPKEFIISDDFFEEENELKLKYNLYKNLQKNRRNKSHGNEKNTNIGKNKNKTIYENKNKDSQSSFSEENKSESNNSEINNKNTENNNDISDMYSSNSSSSTTKKEMQRKEEEEKEKERRRIENEKFKEELSQKEKNNNAKRHYKSYIMPHPEIKSIINDYSKKQNKIYEEIPKNTNLLKLNDIGNVVKNLPKDNLDMKYEPKQYLNKYMFHNYDHLLPIPKSERVSSGSLSSDIRNELLKLQQLREKQMVERIFFKKIIANQKILKGYNEDFYPFSFDECILRRKENVTYKIIFWNYLREVNLIINVIYDENYFDNRYLKIYLLGLSIYTMLFFNIFFYSDKYINDFYLHKGKYNFFFQITKSLYSTLITVIFIKLMSLLISSKNRLRKIIINRKYETDKDYVHDYKFILIILLIKIIIFFLILILVLLFGWYYYILFSIPYQHSQKFVLIGTIFSFLFYEIFSIGIVALVSGFKYSSIKSQSRGLYDAMSIVNLFL